MKRRPVISIDVKSLPPPVNQVTADGSLRGEDISVSMSGLRVGEKSDMPSQHETSGTAAGAHKMQLADLQMMRPLGEGVSGMVQLVEYKPTGQKFAMKVINIGVTEEEKRRILFEARTLHASDVPGIIAFKDAFYADGAVHLVLEYMDCGSLADCITRHGRGLPEAFLAHIAAALLGGIEHLHRKHKIIHRDIKPGNMLLNSRGQAKLADFGMSGQLASTFARLASWVGTAAYMAPERIAGEEYSYESDVWSLGLSLLECALGRYPFGNKQNDGAAHGGGIAAAAAFAGAGGGGGDGRGVPGAGAGAGVLAGGGGGGAGGDDQNEGNTTARRHADADEFETRPREHHCAAPMEVLTCGMTFWELLTEIVEGEPARLPPDEFSSQFISMIAACTRKAAAERPSATELLKNAWVAPASEKELNAWIDKLKPR